MRATPRSSKPSPLQTRTLSPQHAWQPASDEGHDAHPLSDATFGSDTARHEGALDLQRLLPEATAACCQRHGITQRLHCQKIVIEGSGPTLKGLMMAAGAFSPSSTTVALFLGGCGAPAAATVVPIASGYLTQGAAVCVIDYRGFGCSAGAPSDKGLYTDGERMIAHLTQTMGVPLKHIVLHGYALGATIAAELAARCAESHGAHVGGLVLDRPMASVLAPVACDQNTGLGYLSGLLGQSTDADEDDRNDDDGGSQSTPRFAMGDDHISHKLERIDPATPTVLLSGAKDSLGVSGSHLHDILQRCGFQVQQAHLCSDATLSCYELFSCSEGCLGKLCQAIES